MSWTTDIWITEEGDNESVLFAGVWFWDLGSMDGTDNGLLYTPSFVFLWTRQIMMFDTIMYTGISANRKAEADGISFQPYNQVNEARETLTVNLVGLNN